MTHSDFGREVLLSLPPMESKDFTAAKSDLSKLDAFEEDAMKEVDERKCTAEIAKEKDSSLRSAIHAKLLDYQSRYLDKDLTTRLTLQSCPDAPSGSGEMVARTYLELLDVQNCRAGNWSTEWKIKPNKETEAEVSGTSRLHIHYYENGYNVQLRLTRQFPAESAGTAEEQVNSIVAKMEARTMSYEDKVAKAIVKQISAREKELYNQMTEMCEQVDENLKKVRRILPITKTRFKWDAAAQKQVRLLNDRKTS